MQYDLHVSDVTLFASDGVTAKLAPCKLKGGRALRLDYQFKGAGHTLIRVPVALALSGEIGVPVKLVVPAANANSKAGVDDDFVIRTITIENLPATVEIDLD